MATTLIRPTVSVEVETEEVSATNGAVTLDALTAPYALADVDLPLDASTSLEDLDPRDDTRVIITAGDATTGGTRTFDLGLRSREVDHQSKSVRLMLASDEALLQDFAPLGQYLGALPYQSSLRAIVNYVLAKIGAALDPVGPDQDFTTYTDATNMIIDPGTASTSGGGYSSGNCAVDFNDASWSISGDGDSFNLYSPTNADSFLIVGSSSGTRLSGLSDGKRYVFSATGNVKVAYTGTSLGDDSGDGNNGPVRRVRALVVHTRVGSGGYTIWHSQSVPNTINTPTRVSVEFTVPVGATEVFLRAYLGNTAGQIRWDGFRLSEKDDQPGAENTDYFDGDTLDTAGYLYEWTGVKDNSTSKRIALIDRSPDLLVWEAGVTAWDFLSPLLTSVGYRLFCDEHRVWRLIDPAEYEVDGFVSIAGFNATRANDMISRQDPQVFATGVVVRYHWKDSTTAEDRTAYDSAGTTEKVYVLDYERPYPGPGAAAAILARRNGSGRTQDVTGLVNWIVTPGMTASITLPGVVEQQGKLSSVRFSLGDDGLMDVGTRGLIDIPPGSWLDWDETQAWTALLDTVTWNSLPA